MEYFIRLNFLFQMMYIVLHDFYFIPTNFLHQLEDIEKQHIKNTKTILVDVQMFNAGYRFISSTHQPIPMSLANLDRELKTIWNQSIVHF
jgi:N-glycosylase/DNA lyase